MSTTTVDFSTRTADFGPGRRVPPRPVRRPRPGLRALLAVVVALAVAVPIFAGVVALPVRAVKISGEFVRVSRADIERAVEPLLAPGVIGIDVDALRRAALDVPGVREATVRRAWVDSLEIWVVERVAVARWASGGYLEIDGTHFTTSDFTTSGGAPDDALPVLVGPEDSRQRVLDLHVALERLLAPLGLPLAGTELTPRGVVYATLDGGPRLVMRHDARERDIEVYARTLAKVMAGRLHEVERVDFRYPAGFAVRMKADAAGSSEKPA